jgi:hypothetical protein
MCVYIPFICCLFCIYVDMLFVTCISYRIVTKFILIILVSSFLSMTISKQKASRLLS